MLNKNLNTLKYINEKIKPDTFVTLTLKQGISFDSGLVLYGSQEVYDRVWKSVISELSRKYYGARRWRFGKKRILNLSTLEGDGVIKRWHIHACVRRPNGVTLDQFEQDLREVLYRSRWALPDVRVEEIRGGAMAYIVKEGWEAILPGSSSF